MSGPQTLQQRMAKLEVENERLRALIATVREELAERMDTVDTNDGPAPSWEMRLVAEIDRVVRA